MKTREARRRLAALLIVIGMAIQLATTLHWRPISFVIFAILGLFPIAAAVAIVLGDWLRLFDRFERRRDLG